MSLIIRRNRCGASVDLLLSPTARDAGDRFPAPADPQLVQVERSSRHVHGVQPLRAHERTRDRAPGRGGGPSVPEVRELGYDYGGRMRDSS